MVGTMNGQTVSKKQVESALQVMMAVAEAIRAAGPDGLPSGNLYAVVMTTGLSLPEYEKLVSILIGSGVVEKTSAHVLRWTGKVA